MADPSSQQQTTTTSDYTTQDPPGTTSQNPSSTTTSSTQQQPLHIDLNSPNLRSLHDSLANPPLQSPTAARDAERKKNSAADWKPSFERKQSWSREDQKHGLHMTGMQGGAAGGQGGRGTGGSGFTERDGA
jgi:hypothetical protein